MNKLSKAATLLFCLLLASCGSILPPTQQQAADAVTAYLKQNRGMDSPKVTITQIGDHGQADLDGPGSHDDFWPVQFSYSNDVIKLGPIKATKDGSATAKLWKDKQGMWQLADFQSS